MSIAKCIFKMSKIKGQGLNVARGFTLLEIIIYIAIVSIILLLVSSVMFYFTQSHFQTKGKREVMENARRALEIMAYEISEAKSIYTPTTSANQLSLETSRYLPEGEDTTYIDFFICDVRICFKKESQDPFAITSDALVINNLTFTQVAINNLSSVKISFQAQYQDTFNGLQPSVTLTSTAYVRDY